MGSGLPVETVMVKQRYPCLLTELVVTAAKGQQEGYVEMVLTALEFFCLSVCLFVLFLVN